MYSVLFFFLAEWNFEVFYGHIRMLQPSPLTPALNTAQSKAY